MSPTPGGIDQSWGQASQAAVRAAVKAAPGGNFVVSMYLSLDPSKNVTAADVKRYHPAGAGMLINWEHQAGAPLKGAAQGRADATEAVRQLRALIKAVGYAPKTRLIIYFSCDRDVTAAQIRGPVADYYKDAAAVCHANGFGVGAYGEADLVKYLAAQKITDAEWQTYAWSRGVLDPAADFYQYQNGQKLGGADVDFDRIIHAAELGAWWPPGRQLDATPAKPAQAPTPDLLEQLMALDRKSPDYLALIADIAQAVATSDDWRTWHDNNAKGYSLDTVLRLAVGDKLTAILDPAKLAAQIAAKLPPSAGGVATDQIEAAVRAVFADAGSAQ